MSFVQLVKNGNEQPKISEQNDKITVQIRNTMFIACPNFYILNIKDIQKLPERARQKIQSFLEVPIIVGVFGSEAKIRLEPRVQTHLNVMLPSRIYSLAGVLNIHCLFNGKLKRLLSKFEETGNIRSATQRYLDLHFNHLKCCKIFELRTNPYHPDLLQDLLHDKIKFNDLDEYLKQELDDFIEDQYDSDVLVFKLSVSQSYGIKIPFDYGIFYGYPWDSNPSFVTIGRLDYCTISLQHLKLSKNHAQISYQPLPNNPCKKAFLIFDGDQINPSTNATFLRVKRPIEISQKTQILFENTILEADPNILNRRQSPRRKRLFQIKKYLEMKI